MVTTSGLTIKRMIVHKVDHKQYGAPLLSDLESPVNDPEVVTFLTRHIADSREHRYARKARFVAKDPPGAGFMALCDSLLADPAQFTPQSQAMAQRLFACMTGSTSPGDLVVITYCDGGAGAPLCLALLKMDPKDGFVGERQPVDGKYRTVLRRVPDVLPAGELQKCAFILPPGLRTSADHDLIVLDQQIARYGARLMVSDFFSKDFLQIRLAHEPAYSTEQFYYASYDWLNRQEQWSRQDRELAAQHIKEALYGQLVDATYVAAAITSDPEEQQDYLEHLKRQGLDLAFEPDPQLREKLVRYAHFEGDHELALKILSTAVGAGQALSWEKQPGTGQTVVTIHTTTWREKPR
jgi:hypothetical protein